MKILAFVSSLGLLSASAAAAATKAPCKIDCNRKVKCMTKYDPVCGSDQTTYTNQCEFEAAYCHVAKDAPPLTKLHDGACETGNTSPFCAMRCTAQYMPVCGNDGKTYSNACMLLSSKCGTPDLEQAHDGECKRDCDGMCTKIYKPVCGSDGKTYSNECFLGLATCTVPNLEVAHDGECDPISPCNDMCPEIFKPVCGSNGVTYENACRLEYAACTNPEKKITQKKTGACKKLIKPTNPPQKPGVCSKPKCPKTYKPLCGSDNVTYNNECLFAYALCKNPDLRVSAKGVCPTCIPPMCANIYSPVCANDGQTYGNPCVFSYAQCLNASLAVVSSTECGTATPGDAPLQCASMLCAEFTECKVDEAGGDAYCAEVCAEGRCAAGETCELKEVQCVRAPCPPVAHCIAPPVPK